MKKVASVLVASVLLALTACIPAQAHACTRGHFADALTRGLGAEVTLHTRRAWQAQLQAEGGSAANNGLNTTQRWPGSTDYNWVGVQNYRSCEDGVAATVKTLGYKGYGYGWIIQAVRRNYSAVRIVKAIGNSAWGTNGSLALAVLDDIKNHRAPNTLSTLERVQIAGW